MRLNSISERITKFSLPLSNIKINLFDIPKNIGLPSRAFYIYEYIGSRIYKNFSQKNLLTKEKI